MFDEQDVRERADELATFVRAASAEHGLEPGTLRAVGFSNGANIASALLLLHPDLLACAVLVPRCRRSPHCQPPTWPGDAS